MDNKKRVPLGPVVGLLLMALMLLGAVLYWRATRLQRFAEPALAIFEPKIAYAARFEQIMIEELGGTEREGVEVSENLIRIRRALLHPAALQHHGGGSVTLRLATAFRRLLKDPVTRPNIDVVLIIERVPEGLPTDEHFRMRQVAHGAALRALLSLFQADPELEKEFSTSFASAVIAGGIGPNDQGWVEFHIIPSESVHIEILKRIEKYAK